MDFFVRLNKYLRVQWYTTFRSSYQTQEKRTLEESMTKALKATKGELPSVLHKFQLNALEKEEILRFIHDKRIYDNAMEIDEANTIGS